MPIALAAVAVLLVLAAVGIPGVGQLMPVNFAALRGQPKAEFDQPAAERVAAQPQRPSTVEIAPARPSPPATPPPEATTRQRPAPRKAATERAATRAAVQQAPVVTEQPIEAPSSPPQPIEPQEPAAPGMTQGTAEWRTNLPRTRAVVTTHASTLHIELLGNDAFDGYVGDLRWEGERFAGQVARARCDATSRWELRFAGGVLVGTLEKLCGGRGRVVVVLTPPQ